MTIQIEDVLTKTCDIDKFDEIEGWDTNLMKATIHYIYELNNSNNAKITTHVLSAWDALDSKDKVILEEHFGRKNVVILGISFVEYSRIKNESMKHMFGGIIEKIMRIEEDKDDKD